MQPEYSLLDQVFGLPTIDLAAARNQEVGRNGYEARHRSFQLKGLRLLGLYEINAGDVEFATQQARLEGTV
jgi:hypothetical protein